MSTSVLTEEVVSRIDLINGEQTVSPASLEVCLRNFTSTVMLTRTEFLKQLTDRLPLAIGNLATATFCDRCTRHGSMPLLAEYLPWLIAEALGFDDREITRRTTVAWLHIYTSITMLDEVIDGQTTKSADSHIIVATLLLQRGLCQSLAISGGQNGLLEALNNAFVETAMAHLDPPLVFRDLGSKAAAFTGPAETFLALSGGDPETVSWMRQIAAHVGTGWQGLDDITDYEEDYRTGNISPLLRRIVNAEGSLLPKDLKREDLLFRLTKDGAFGAALTCVRDAFESAYELLDKRVEEERQSTLQKYLAILLKLIDQVIVVLDDNRRAFAASTNWQDVLVKQKLMEVDRSLALIAQGS